MDKNNYYYLFIGSLFCFLYAQVSHAFEVELKVNCLNLPVCQMPSGPISLFMPDFPGAVTAKGIFIADVKTTLEPHEEHLSGEIKIEYRWSAGNLKIIGEKQPQCTVLVQSSSEWGILYPVTCTVTVTAGDNTKTVKSEEKDTTPPSAEIEEIHFNHDTESSVEDAMNLNKEFQGNTVLAPEWTRTNKAEPFLYKGKSNPTIKAKIKLKPDRLTFGEIRADQGKLTQIKGKEKEGDLLGPLKSKYFFNNELTLFELEKPIQNTLTHDYQSWA